MLGRLYNGLISDKVEAKCLSKFTIISCRILSKSSYFKTKLTETTNRVKKKLQRYLDPIWVPPPTVLSHDFCEDYVYDWAICYAIGSMGANDQSFHKSYHGKVVGYSRL